MRFVEPFVELCVQWFANYMLFCIIWTIIDIGPHYKYRKRTLFGIIIFLYKSWRFYLGEHLKYGYYLYSRTLYLLYLPIIFMRLTDWMCINDKIIILFWTWCNKILRLFGMSYHYWIAQIQPVCCLSIERRTKIKE